MRRVMIVGGPGAGKSTLAVELGQRLGLSVHHLDRMFWSPGWHLRPVEERRAALAAVLGRDGYVLEGGYPETLDARLADCDTLIWLDHGLLCRARRLWHRLHVHGHRPRPDLADGCLDADRRHYWQLWRIFWFRHLPRRLREARLAARASGRVAVFHLRHPQDVKRFLADLPTR